MKTFLRTFVFTLSIALLSASSAFAVLPKILIMGSEQPTWIVDVQTKLTNTGQFAQVDYQEIPSYGGSLPSLATLEGYGSVMIFDDGGLGAGTGALLASYVDWGGGVVVCHFCLATNELPIDASFNNSTYQVIVPGTEVGGTQTLGTVVMPNHPIMANVSSLNGGSSSYHGNSTTLAGNSYTIAKWSDGSILVAAREGVGANNKARRVDIDMFPVSSTMRSDFWQASTNGDILMANAMTWATGSSGPPPELNLTPKSLNFGTIPPGSPVTSCVTAYSVGAANLHIKGIALSGPSDFTVTTIGKNVGDSILPGNNTQYCITFNPTQSGTRTATFTLTTDGRDSGTQVVNLTGNGVLPAVSYSTNALFRQVGVELTDTSQAQYVKISSTGLGPLLINSIYTYGLNANNYFIVHYPQSPLQPGATDSVGIKFAPSIEGRPDANLVINTNTLNNPSDTISLNGIGILPRLVINNTYPPKPSTPATGTTITTTINVSFGTVNVGGDSCMNILLANPGSDTLAIEKNFFSSADYDFSLTPLNGTDSLILPGGGTQEVQVCFTPLKQGTRTATLRITTNIPHTFDFPPHDTSGFSVNITGIGVPFGHLAVTGPDTIPVSAVGTKLCWEDTLWNTGLASVLVKSAAITGTNATEFTYSGLTFPLNLAPNAYQTFMVCGDPTADSTRTALFTAVGTTGGEGGAQDTITGSLALNIFGTTVCDTLAWVTKFPAATCFGTTDTGVISVTNCGNVPTQYMASVTGADEAMFKVLNPTSSLESGGGVATFMVTYTPDTVQADVTSTAVFNIAGGANGTLPLSATRNAAVIAGSGTAAQTPVGSSVNFTATVMNTGQCDWNPGTPLVPAPFTYVSGAANIPAGGTGTWTFTFAPTTPGTITVPVTFQNPVGVSVPWAAVSVTGTTGTSSVAMVSAQNGYSIDQSYPNPNTGTSNVEITLPNSGNVHLAILDITGNVVQNVMDREMDAGSFTVKIEASDLANGTYFYQMTSGGVTLTRQMTIVK